jgi:hypothetical protein
MTSSYLDHIRRAAAEFVIAPPQEALRIKRSLSGHASNALTKSRGESDAGTRKAYHEMFRAYSTAARRLKTPRGRF